MDGDKNKPAINTQAKPYTTPHLTVFGDVRSLTATGSAGGSETGGSQMNMIRP